MKIFFCILAFLKTINFIETYVNYILSVDNFIVIFCF